MPDGSGRVPDFNPHHRMGGDRYQYPVRTCLMYFNPHHRTGGDSKSNQKNAYHPAFYQHFCTNNYNKNFLIYYINPTHPTKIKCEPPRLFMFTSHSHFFVGSCLLSVFHIIKGSRISILSFTPICSTLFL